MSLAYLGQPYTSDDESVMERRYNEGMEAAATLFNEGVNLYAPIVAWHAVAMAYNLPVEAAPWQALDREILQHCDTMYVLMLDGWEASKGLIGEIGFAEDRGIKLIYI